jgi:hypothetical protein
MVLFTGHRRKLNCSNDGHQIMPVVTALAKTPVAAVELR